MMILQDIMVEDLDHIGKIIVHMVVVEVQLTLLLHLDY